MQYTYKFVVQEAKNWHCCTFTPLHDHTLLLACSSLLIASAVAESCRHASRYEEGAVEEPDEEQRQINHPSLSNL